MVVAGKEGNFEGCCLLGNVLKSPVWNYRPVETDNLLESVFHENLKDMLAGKPPLLPVVSDKMLTERHLRSE